MKQNHEAVSQKRLTAHGKDTLLKFDKAYDIAALDSKTPAYDLGSTDPHIAGVITNEIGCCSSNHVEISTVANGCMRDVRTC